MKSITADRMRERRTSLGMTADQLGEKIGKNRATVYRYESGEIENMPIGILIKLAEALNCSATWLLGMDELAPKSPVDAEAQIFLDAYNKADDETKTVLRRIIKTME